MQRALKQHSRNPEADRATMPFKGEISVMYLQPLAENNLQDKVIIQRTSFIFPRLMHIHIQREKSKGVCKRGREMKQRQMKRTLYFPKVEED